MNTISIKVPNDGFENNFVKTKITKWYVNDNTEVVKDQIILKIENDYYELDFPSEYDGIIKIIKKEGDEVKVGDIVCKIDVK